MIQKINLNNIDSFQELCKSLGNVKTIRRILFLLKNEGCTVAYRSMVENDYNYDDELEYNNYESQSLIRFDFLKNGEITRKNKKNYLGYIQIRPCNKHYPINDAFLTIPKIKINSSSFFVTCKSKKRIEMFNGDFFDIIGFFFAQRDGNLGACAQACFRMLSNYSTRGLLTIKDINEIADKQQVAETRRGLDIASSQKVFEHLNFHPLLHLNPSIATAEEIIYTYVESKIPIIVLFHIEKSSIGTIEKQDFNNDKLVLSLLKQGILVENKTKNNFIYFHNKIDSHQLDEEDFLNTYLKEQIENINEEEIELTIRMWKKHINNNMFGHSVLVIGHTFESNAWWPEAHHRYYHTNLRYGQYLNSHLWVNFIAHDDNYGPFLIFPRLFEKLYNPYALLIPLSFKITIKAEHVNPIVLRALQSKAIMEKVMGYEHSIWFKTFLECLRGADGNKLVFRTYLTNKKDFLIKINNSKNASENLKDFYNSEVFNPPHNFWITEISTPELFSQQRYCLGEVILDPNPSGVGVKKNQKKSLYNIEPNKVVKYIHIAGFMIRILKKDKYYYQSIPNDTPYTHMIHK